MTQNGQDLQCTLSGMKDQIFEKHSRVLMVFPLNLKVASGVTDMPFILKWFSWVISGLVGAQLVAWQEQSCLGSGQEV